MTEKIQNSSLFYQKYQIQSQIGRGASGVCYKIRKTIDNKIYALKKISSNSIKRNNIKAAYNEVTILSSLTHPNIIKYHQSFMDQNQLYIIMQYAPKGDLHTILKKRKIKQHFFEEKQIFEMIKQLLGGLQYLHAKNIIHRDIKTLNIFVDQRDNLVIGDLGVSKIIKSDLGLYSRVGTPLYLPPEIIKYEKYDFKADVWGLGCVAYLLATLNHPFEGKNIISLGQNIVGKEPKPIQKYSQSLKSLIFEMLQKDHIKRLSPSMLLKKYFSGHEKIVAEIKIQEQKKPIQNSLIEANNTKQTQVKKSPQKPFQRRYLTTKKIEQSIQGLSPTKNKIQPQTQQNLKNDKKLRYMIGNFVNQISEQKKQKIDTFSIPNKTFQNTIAIKPNKIIKEEEQFKDGNEQITKTQKQPINMMKKPIYSQGNLKLKQQLEFDKIKQSSQKPQKSIPTLGQRIQIKSNTFQKIKQNNFTQSAQCFQPYCQSLKQLYPEKKNNIMIRKMPTQTKCHAETENLRQNKQYSVIQIKQSKGFVRNSQRITQSADQQEKAMFIDIFKMGNEVNFDAKQPYGIGRFRQRPKSSIGKKERYGNNDSNSSTIKPKRKQNLYSNFYSIIQTKVLKKPQVIVL